MTTENETRTRPLYGVIASTIQARANCAASGNTEWFGRHTETLRDLESFLPSGSGIDSGCRIVEDESTGEKIAIDLGYHHMNEAGGYDGWTEHRATIKASLVFGLRITIDGSNRGDVKDYLHESLEIALHTPMVADYSSGRYIRQQVAS